MGTLFIVSTPIGNLEDITIRAIKTLFSVDIVACEDTRRAGILLQELTKRYSATFSGLERKSPKLIRFDDHTEQNATVELIANLSDDHDVALISDAGTPLVSDPGFRLVSESLKRGIKVTSVPGASALLTALSSSGLAANQFMFLGYPPEKQSHRLKLFGDVFQCFKTLEHLSPTIICYCAPHKLESTLLDMKETFGDIEITVARELTKIHEQIWKGPISKALDTPGLQKGELVILFHLN